MKETASYSFYSSDLNKNKYEEFLRKALAIREFKNALSLEICQHLEDYLDCSKFDFVKKFGKTKDNPLNPSSLIRGNELQKACADVFDSYQNKFEAIVRSIRFSVQTEIRISRYKRKAGAKKAGDVKSYEVKKESTKLCKVLDYLSKYFNSGLIEYLKGLEDRNHLQADVLYYLDKYKYRLIQLALLRKENVTRKYSYPIKFDSLTYRTAIQSKDFLVQDKNRTCHSSVYLVIPSINGQGSRKIIVPSKIHSKYHGKSSEYQSKEYIVQVQPTKKRVRFILTREVDREYKVGQEEFLGVDVNLKHNLFSLSIGENIDFDRRLLKLYTTFLKKIDQKKELTKGEEKQKKLWQTRIEYHLKEKSSELVNLAISAGKNHIVMEDLSLLDKTCIRNEEFNEFKYSRLTKLLHLSSLNNIVRSICLHKGLQFTTIPSHYTSQTCSACGTIERENRQNQETFSCINCGENRNADVNASINIALIGQYEVKHFEQDLKEVPSKLLIEDKKTKWLSAKSFLKKEFIKSHLVDIITSSSFQMERKKFFESSQNFLS